MQRPITGFHLDADGDWVAELSCGHGQHVRHKPPFMLRPWVMSEDGRTSRLGSALDCTRCDQLEPPENLRPYQRTAVFREDSIPSALLRSHSTREGVWALIHVLAGEILYVVEAQQALSDDTAKEVRSFVLSPSTRGVICPQVPHHVTVRGPVEFFVEFHRAE